MAKSSVRRSRQCKHALRERPAVRPDAAGIDLGATEHFVAVPPERDPQPVRCFTTDTAALQTLADWLVKCGVRTVAMEATGVYWVPLFQVLEARGLGIESHIDDTLETHIGDSRQMAGCHGTSLIKRTHAGGLWTRCSRAAEALRPCAGPTASAGNVDTSGGTAFSGTAAVGCRSVRGVPDDTAGCAHAGGRDWRRGAANIRPGGR
jgi:hypothetical protein